MNHTHVSLVGTQLNIFLTTPTLPVNVSTRHAVEADLIHSVTLDRVPEITKIHKGCSPQIKDSAKQFSYHPYPSCTWLNKACSRNIFAPFCSHPMPCQCPRKYTNSTVVYHTLVLLVGTQLNNFLTTPTLPIHVSTRHGVEEHLQSPYAFCDI